MREIKMVTITWLVTFTIILFGAWVARAEVVPIGGEWEYHIKKLGIYPAMAGDKRLQEIRLIGDETRYATKILAEMILQSIWHLRPDVAMAHSWWDANFRSEPGIQP